MSIFADTDPTIKETLCLAEGLRLCGVGDGQVRLYYVVADASRKRTALLGDRTHIGDLTVVVRVSREVTETVSSDLHDAVLYTHEVEWFGTVGPVRVPEPVFGRWFDQAVALWNKAPAEEKAKLWGESVTRKKLPGLEIKLRQRGLVTDGAPKTDDVGKLFS